jgi:WhiB family redox-sensing transcriptional regulator
VALLDEIEEYTTGPTVNVLLQPAQWQRHAAWAGMDVEIFFPERGGSSKKARAVCARCEVTEECLAYALQDQDSLYNGIRGGTSPRERRQLLRDSKIRLVAERV